MFDVGQIDFYIFEANRALDDKTLCLKITASIQGFHSERASSIQLSSKSIRGVLCMEYQNILLPSVKVLSHALIVLARNI